MSATVQQTILGTLESGIEIGVPAAEPGIGKVILSPTSADLIEGVQIRPFAVWPDDRGYFLEVARIGQGLVADFRPESTQVSAALNYPGIIKAFHYHRYQTDFWVPAAGLLQVALVDLRRGSLTYAQRIRFMSAHCGLGKSSFRRVLRTATK